MSAHEFNWKIFKLKNPALCRALSLTPRLSGWSRESDWLYHRFQGGRDFWNGYKIFRFYSQIHFHLYFLYQNSQKKFFGTKKYYIRRPIFNYHHNMMIIYLSKVIHPAYRKQFAWWLGLWADQLARASSIRPHDTLLLFHK